ncbi:hypothetical protein TNIN_156421 [Trichonephila inaurata madagascariensis]|uniref:Uncharacterized protein n=1 Tax=Trichonephila inaurata madagascariensis TaxID=2747483 RepID=A0A8X6YL59_9ARAC|nr:hypothetical protein TNIN_156421 [Trichonephila inaurata madagascariensis]
MSLVLAYRRWSSLWCLEQELDRSAMRSSNKSRYIPTFNSGGITIQRDLCITTKIQIPLGWTDLEATEFSFGSSRKLRIPLGLWVIVC